MWIDTRHQGSASTAAFLGIVNRSFNRAKQWRGLATRYDKLTVVYRGAAVLHAITLWLKRLGDTP